MKISKVSNSFSRRRIALAVASLALAAASDARAQSVEPFYRDKQLRLIIATEAGGDYDVWARAVGRHLGRHIPGHPLLVPVNMPGGGQITATNYLYDIAPKDGSVIGMIGRNAAGQALAKLAAVKYDPAKFNWLGTPGVVHAICVAMDTAPVKSARDLLEKELIVGGAGAGTTVTTTPILLRNLLGMKFNLVEGYRVSTNVILAMERGEVQGICQAMTGFQQARPDWISSGRARVLFNMERDPIAGLGAPSIYEFAKTDEQRGVLDLVASSGELGRPLVAPPEVPPERVAALRRAFDATMTDADFLVEAKKLRLDIHARSGEALEAVVKNVMATQPDVVAKAEALSHR